MIVHLAGNMDGRSWWCNKVPWKIWEENSQRKESSSRWTPNKPRILLTEGNSCCFIPPIIGIMSLSASQMHTTVNSGSPFWPVRVCNLFYSCLWEDPLELWRGFCFFVCVHVEGLFLFSLRAFWPMFSSCKGCCRIWLKVKGVILLYAFGVLMLHMYYCVIGCPCYT